MDKPVTGQRWVSNSEPELGLGIILKADFGRVEILFPAAGEHRQYALKNAPLRRVLFKEGDSIRSHQGESFTVVSVEEKDGLLIYQTDKRPLPEAELSDSISFSKPEDRLLVGQVDDFRLFDLRVEALMHRSGWQQSPVRGYVGGRVDLIPHQLFIAGEVSSRLLPRVLLADEVGLGKTIEAGLILHRLHLTGRAGRILVLLPEPLIHQWFVEMLRKFNLMFSLFDEERCVSIEANDPEANPFLDSQLVIASITYLSENEKRASQVCEAGWDLVVVDEAHHLEWTPESASPSYKLVEELAGKTPGILLLTATPQQLGPEGHFARLRLLDSERHADLAKFTEEAEHYTDVAQAVDRLLAGGPLDKKDRKLFATKSPRIKKHCDELAGGNEESRSQLTAELLDEFGTGRVMFRNTRAALTGFPERKALLHPLKLKAKDQEPVEAIVLWLVKLLQELPEEKVLVICKTRELVEEIQELLLREINVGSALFHEGLTLMQRDRNAAHFASEEGARVLICSEIGSEGRNFQFAHHLALFDLPENPELLEQRIGRLDRIGQTSLIHIHVPYVVGSPQEVLARWYHEGVNAFEKNLHGAAEIAKTLQSDLQTLLEGHDARKLTAFIKKSQKLSAAVGKKLEQGHDRLLELNSFRAEPAAAIIEEIQALDQDREFEDFFLRLLDHFGMVVEDMGHRSYLLTPGNELTHALPGMPEEGLSVTFDRVRALSREDVTFMTTDHPMVRGALDLLVSENSGNSSFAIRTGTGAEGLLVEVCHVIECTAPPSLHADRFLPLIPVHLFVDHSNKDLTADLTGKAAKLEKGDISKLLDRPVVKNKIVPGMIKQSATLAKQELEKAVAAALEKMEAQLQAEIERLEDLQQINDHVRPEEVEALREQKAGLHQAISSAHLRLDAVRLMWQMP